MKDSDIRAQLLKSGNLKPLQTIAFERVGKTERRRQLQKLRAPKLEAQEQAVSAHKKQKGYTLIELLIVIAFIVIVALVLGGGYVAFHFVSKFW